MSAAPRTAPFYIVLNVGSGHGDSDEAQTAIGNVLTEAGQPHEFFLAKNTDDISTIAQRAVVTAQKNNGIVIAAGGDGTINAVAQAVLDGNVPFGVLPQGTFNYFGRTHAIPTDTVGATRALLNATLQPAQVGLLNDRVFLVNASIGLYPQLLEDRETYKQKFGRFRLVALWSGLATLLRGYPQLRLSIERDGKKTPLRTPTFFVGNNALQLQQIGIPEADAQPRGFLVAVTPQPVSRWSMLGLIFRGARGKLGEANAVNSFAFKEAVVRLQFQSQRRIKVATDGEVLWMETPLSFRVSPQPLQLLIPADSDKVVEQP
ncbi:MAG: diacylglycerol kinase [Verrucomicrobiaceae bacterium]|nr:diacylglycerol kinase [Verrucomicrobiaceae bacterium]